MTDQAAAGVKLDVITGPGRYEVVHDEPGRVQPGQLVPVVRDTEWGDNPKTPWLADLGCGLQVFIGNDGVSPSGGFRVRRADAAARIASLEAENAALKAERRAFLGTAKAERAYATNRLYREREPNSKGTWRRCIEVIDRMTIHFAEPEPAAQDADAREMLAVIEGEAK
jgi:hypothetical protein